MTWRQRDQVFPRVGNGTGFGPHAAQVVDRLTEDGVEVQRRLRAMRAAGDALQFGNSEFVVDPPKLGRTVVCCGVPTRDDAFGRRSSLEQALASAMAE